MQVHAREMLFGSLKPQLPAVCTRLIAVKPWFWCLTYDWFVRSVPSSPIESVHSVELNGKGLPTHQAITFLFTSRKCLQLSLLYSEWVFLDSCPGSLFLC